MSLPPFTKKHLDSIMKIGEEIMAKYDHGGGCPCGLYRECDPGCVHYVVKSTLKEPERKLSNQYTKEECQPMKQLYDQPADATEIPLKSMKRPWGSWVVLDVDQGYKVKRLDILPDQAISLQYHNHRSEHWTIVQGIGKVIVDGNIFTIKKGESFHVPKQAIHKITNTHLTETLIAIEVQMGDICSEEDIVRC